MWSGFDARMWRDLVAFRELVALRRQTPIKEWPLVCVGEHRALFVVREWPDGSVTAYVVENPDVENA